jgi:ribosomal protein S12 methylthiotransferase
MGRRGTKEKIITTINKLRLAVKDMVLRTTLIVGFPGESDEDFNELKEFIKEVKFDKLGVFKYSPEEGTPASTMENQIAESTKEIREKEIMLLQQKVSKEINRLKIGRTFEVLIESENNGEYLGRSREMAPDIDGDIIIRSLLKLSIGDVVKVKIVDALEYDLIGDVYYESC